MSCWGPVVSCQCNVLTGMCLCSVGSSGALHHSGQFGGGQQCTAHADRIW